MSTPSSLPRAPHPHLRSHGERASAVPTVSQPSAGAPPIPTIGGFALKAIAHLKPPADTVKQ